MQIEITEEEKNELLNRKEISFSIVHDEETPSRLAVRDSLAAKLDKDSDEVVVHKMDTKFGMNETLGHAKIYESPDDAREIEEEYMLERNKIGAEEAEEAEEGDEEAEA
ncbi:MAG: small subunit ribosomal protein S24e [Methanobacteriota archaeon]|jgi:small subunit ribosomal protein S24e|uniref:Small ribosomal subunit protein eS24 n=1 Tax=Halorutilus salinus TaxID=2487751 RepID=A0A9Q4C6A7_9EURY|nr:30S ribosomal protein S24e [Halorutilus salinus]MCX2820033.1 30S ribosomal protein S24e [Halorutilus salinus]